MSSDAFFKRFGGQVESTVTTQNEPQAAEPTQGNSFFDRFKPTADTLAAVEGATPESAIKESPLGILDRAQLGWEKTPAAQQKALEEHFGKDKVKFLDSSEGGGFVVQNKDGKWYEADPHFQWNFSGKGAAAGAVAGGVMAGPPGVVVGGIAGAISPSFGNVKNLKDLPGDVAQFAGQYGLKSIAAAKGAAYGATVGAAAGPIGAIGGAVIGGGVGALGEDIVETGARAAANKVGIGREESLPQDPKELKDQLMASFVFGATQEFGNQTLKLGYKGSVMALQKLADRVSNTPAGQAMLAHLLESVSGVPANLQRVRISNPKAMTKFDLQAVKDVENNTDTLYSNMRQSVKEFYTEALAKKRQVFKAYDALDEVAAKQEYMPKQETLELVSSLEKAGFTRGGKLANGSSKQIEVDIRPGEKQTIGWLVNQVHKMEATVKQSKNISYDEMSNLIKTIENHMFETDKLINPELRSILLTYKAGLKNHLKSKIPTETAIAFDKLDAQYGPVKDMLEELATKGSDDARVDTLLGKVIRADGKHDSELLKTIATALKLEDPTTDLLRADLARKSTSLFGGKRAFGVIPRSPAVAKGVVSAGGAVRGAVRQFDEGALQKIPYLNKAREMVGSMSAEAKRQLLESPQALDFISKTVSGAAEGEKQATEQMLQQLGVK